MGFVKPTITKTRSVTDPKQDNGQIINPPTYYEIGGLKSASKLSKNKMSVEKPEKGGGPWTKS